MKKTEDQRHFWRAAFHSPARLTFANGVTHESQVCDLSLKGALLEIQGEIPCKTGERCRLQIDLSPEVFIRMQTTVRHVHGQRVGLHCDEIDIDSMTALRRLVELNSGDVSLLERELVRLIQDS